MAVSVAASPADPGLTQLLPELRLLTGLTLLTAVIAGLYFGREVLVPLVLAILLGFVLDPIVSWLKRRGMPRVTAVVIVAVLALGSIGLAGLGLGTQVAALSKELPTYHSNILKKLRAFRADVQEPGIFEGAVETLKVVQEEVDKAAANDPAAARTSRPADSSSVQRVRIEPTPPTAFREILAWIEVSSGPLATAGIVLVFVFLVLLDRDDLRDRLLKLLGGSLHRSTDAMDEAGRLISKYLTMQVVVNLAYGMPMAAGLWLIGVPGAVLWGVVAAMLRFVPYVGPMIAAVAPLTLAFAVDPGWTMVLWTLGLVVLLELVSNNIIEPRLYGTSTGLSAISLIAAATFWTTLWGPIGLILSTPLTVCLLVIGRHLPRLQFLDVLLGSRPALDASTRIYQRLLANEVEAAVEVASEQLVEADVAAFYNTTGLSVLKMATLDHASVASVEHRHRVVIGMDGLIDSLIEQYPPNAVTAPVTVVCIGGKWEIDTLASRMLAHSLSLAGLTAAHRSSSLMTADYIDRLDLDEAKTVCLSFFSAEPQNHARVFCRRLRRRWPHLHIMLVLWNAPTQLLNEASQRDLGADTVVGSLSEAMMQIAHTLGVELGSAYQPAPVAESESEVARLDALRVSGVLDPRARPLLDATARRVADIFDVPIAMVSLIDAERQRIPALYGQAPPESPDAEGELGPALQPQDLEMPRALSLCGHVVAHAQTMVVPDLARDLRFAGNPELKGKGLRFYAGAPLRAHDGHVLGTLCILDAEPRSLTQRELKLLESMANHLMTQLHAAAATWTSADAAAQAEALPASPDLSTPPP